MDVKSFTGLEVKDADKGIVSAVFSTFGVVDKDGDVIEPGAIKDGTPIRVSAYGHASWGRFGAAAELPVGKGTVHTDDTKAWADMEFFMDTSHGADTFKTIKGMGDLQEWSYSLHGILAEYEDTDDGDRVRHIKQVDVHEVSPVLMGAGVGTHTLAAKDGMRFQEHIDAVLADVVALNERAQQVMALRAEKGKAIAGASMDALLQLDAQLKALHTLLASDAEEADDLEAITAEARKQYLLMLARQ